MKLFKKYIFFIVTPILVYLAQSLLAIIAWFFGIGDVFDPHQEKVLLIYIIANIVLGLIVLVIMLSKKANVYKVSYVLINIVLFSILSLLSDSRIFFEK